MMESYPLPAMLKGKLVARTMLLRKYLQELELTESPEKNANQNAIGKEIVNEDRHLSDAKEVLTSRIVVNASIQNDSLMVVTNHAEIDDASEKHIDADRRSQDSASAENVSSKAAAPIVCSESSAEQGSLLKSSAKTVFHSSQEKDNASDTVEKPSSLLGEDFESVSPCHSWTNGDITVFVTEESKLHMVDTRGVTHPSLAEVEDNKQKKAVSEELQGKDGSKDKTEHHDGALERKLERDTSPRQISKAERPKESTLWGTLKSFADGIINIWKK